MSFFGVGFFGDEFFGVELSGGELFGGEMYRIQVFFCFISQEKLMCSLQRKIENGYRPKCFYVQFVHARWLVKCVS